MGKLQHRSTETKSAMQKLLDRECFSRVVSMAQLFDDDELEAALEALFATARVRA